VIAPELDAHFRRAGLEGKAWARAVPRPTPVFMHRSRGFEGDEENAWIERVGGALVAVHRAYRGGETRRMFESAYASRMTPMTLIRWAVHVEPVTAERRGPVTEAVVQEVVDALARAASAIGHTDGINTRVGGERREVCVRVGLGALTLEWFAMARGWERVTALFDEAWARTVGAARAPLPEADSPGPG
jgi:hypothetical protein